MNPFSEKVITTKDTCMPFDGLYPKAYSKNVDPYTKCRIILACGAEFEANWFSHQFSRHCGDNDLRRELAKIRFEEKQQQQKLAMLKPKAETTLQTTIAYEQLAVDLTAELAQRAVDENVKAALDFALLEDFDHLYRYSNLLEMEEGIHAENLVGKYTEITPARPTVAHHRSPLDNVKRHLTAKSDTQSVLCAMIITAAEQQTMNYYMNVSSFQSTDLARKLYQEICLVEEEHVTQYGSLLNPNLTWLENALWHEYCECYLYYSNYMTETDKYVKGIWEEFYSQELVHLHKVIELLKKKEKKDFSQVIIEQSFPKPVSLKSNIDYIRHILGETITFTGDREKYTELKNMQADCDFYNHQSLFVDQATRMPSHKVILERIKNNGADYRFEVDENPAQKLRDRKKDNTDLGRTVQ